MSMSQTNLREPDKMDWDNYVSGSKYIAPPPALDATGRPIVYNGRVDTIEEGVTDEGLRQWTIDFTLVKAGGADGLSLRKWVNVKKWNDKAGNQTEQSSVGAFLRAASIVAKPQKNAEYDAAMKQTKGRVVQFTIDWVAKNKDTGEEVEGFLSFPDDDERPGSRKTILKEGDSYFEVDKKGNILSTNKVESEVLFANARIKYFQDPNRGKK